MKTISLLIALTPLLVFSQILQYSPNRKVERVVDKNHYNTEFIYIQNISEDPVDLSFEVVENTLGSDWHASICTNKQCFNSIPESGSLGSIWNEEKAYFSFNFAANETVGDGQVRFLIRSNANPEISDTVTFKYTVTEDGSIKARPWATINYIQGVVHILIENPGIETAMDIVNMNGQSVFSSGFLNPISSFPLRDHPAGIYLVVIRDENDRIITQKIPHR